MNCKHFVLSAVLCLVSPSLVSSEKQDSWNFIEEEDGIKVYSKDIKGSPLGAFKGETVINAPVKRLFNIISDHKFRGDWVDRLEDIALLQEPTIEIPAAIEYFKIDMPWPLDDREFITESRAVYNLETGAIKTVSKGTTHSSKPPTEGVVRGETKSAHLFLNPLPGNKTHITMDVHADPKGMLPKWVVNFAQRQWPYNTLSKLRELAESDAKPKDTYSSVVELEKKKKSSSPTHR